MNTNYPFARSYFSPGAYLTTNGSRFLDSRIERIFEEAFGPVADPVDTSRFPVDLYEDKANAYVRAELPGFTREDIGVEVVDGVLSIQAARKQAEGSTEESVAFLRTVALSEEVQADKIAATYENGVLTVTLPRRAETTPRKLTVPVS